MFNVYFSDFKKVLPPNIEFHWWSLMLLKYSTIPFHSWSYFQFTSFVMLFANPYNRNKSIELSQKLPHTKLGKEGFVLKTTNILFVLWSLQEYNITNNESIFFTLKTNRTNVFIPLAIPMVSTLQILYIFLMYIHTTEIHDVPYVCRVLCVHETLLRSSCLLAVKDVNHSCKQPK